MPVFEINLNQCLEFNISEANRNAYDAIIVHWHDNTSNTDKSLQVGAGEKVYNYQIPQPKSDAEASRLARYKLEELNRGGIAGRAKICAEKIVAGGQLQINYGEFSGVKFSIKEVRYILNPNEFTAEISFER